MRWLAILNPASGALSGHGRTAALAAWLREEASISVAISGAPGQAEILAREATGYDGLLAAGGDGTVAEVVNGMDRGRQILALLPAGTGNGLARDLGLALLGRGPRATERLPSLAEIAATLHTPRIHRIDLIDVQFRRHHEDVWITRLAVGTTAIGYAAEVVALARGPLSPLSRRLPAGFCYPLGASLQALRQQPFDIRFSLDDQPLTARRATNLMVHSTAHAGNFRAFPAASPDDGCLTVLLADASPIAQLRHNLAVLRQTYGFVTAEARPARVAALQSDRSLRLMLDGELLDSITEVRWTVLPGGLRLALMDGS